ncbi:MAG: c-type cytochrome [Guyparkeria sp.]
MRSMIASLAGLAFALMGPQAMAADADAGKSKYDSVCAACHGAKGEGSDVYPSLQGQSQDEVAEVLALYKAGDKEALKEKGLAGDDYAQMAPNAASLSEDDMKNLGAYIESL